MSFQQSFEGALGFACHPACLSGWERPKLYLRGTRKTTISSEGLDNAIIVQIC